MKTAGAHSAFNMDGGGSSAMYIKEFGPVNDYSDANERSVGNSLFAVSSAPVSTTIASIQAYNPGLRLTPGESVTPKFIAYDAHGNILTKNLSGVKLSCPPELGTLTINTFGTATYTFNATGSGTGLIMAEYQDITTQIRVSIIHPDAVDRVHRISEDFSSPEWDAEFKRLNPPYTTLLPGTQYTDVNNIELYFDKYAFEGGFVSESNNPNCADPNITHANGNGAIALRLRNSGNSYLELPEMHSAGTITLHVRNGNKDLEATLPLLKYENGNWVNIHNFSLRKRSSYGAVSVDEVVQHDINSETPIKLQLFRGDKFISIFRIDVTSFGETAVHTPALMPFRLYDRTLLIDSPTRITLYNLMGVQVFNTYVENKTTIPPSIGNGIFLLHSADGVHKILL
jgi:hypothetical protein